MKLNERVFEVLAGEPIEVQNLDNHEVKIYLLDDYPDVLNEFVNKGKFAVWSSVDGKNYKLAIEKGYYNELRELYSGDVNNTWLQFWDECEAISSKFSKKIVLPATFVVIVIFAVVMLLSKKMPDKVGTYLILGLAIVYVFVVLVLRKLTTNKINMANQNALREIKEKLGENRFQELLECQRNYIDAYYDALSAKDEQMASEEAEEETEASVEDVAEEETEATVEDVAEEEAEATVDTVAEDEAEVTAEEVVNDNTEVTVEENIDEAKEIEENIIESETETVDAEIVDDSEEKK